MLKIGYNVLDVTTLQWGRSTRAPENHPTYVGLGEDELLEASMGPEHEGSGKLPGTGKRKWFITRFNGAGARGLRKIEKSVSTVASLWIASMGPEHEGSGK